MNCKTGLREMPLSLFNVAETRFGFVIAIQGNRQRLFSACICISIELWVAGDPVILHRQVFGRVFDPQQTPQFAAKLINLDSIQSVPYGGFKAKCLN